MTETTPETDRIAVYYDGGCPLCRREIAMYSRRDGAGRLDLVNLEDRPDALAADGVSARDALAGVRDDLARGVEALGAPLVVRVGDGVS
ncbi:MAG: DCC1-like thiol-disulfide oxidoreductase family protein, partial [Azospirillaceae bacterium]